ncbi:MAG: hypothetical protein ACE14P_13380 [Methanotrichaceae archaeon]
MKRLLLVLALIVVVSLSGCLQNQGQGGQPNESTIKTSMLRAADNLSSYNFTVTHNQTDIINELGNNNVANMTIRSAISSVSASIDLANHRARADLMTATSLKTPGEAARVSSSSGTQYNIGNITYTKMGEENWTQLKDLTDANVMWASGRYNALKSRAESIDESQINILGSEVVDGKDCYKLNIATNDTVYNQTLRNAVESVIFPFVANVNMTDLRKNSQIDANAWIEKDNNLVRRYEYNLRLSVIPELVGAVNLSTGQIMMFNQSLRESIRPVAVSIETNNLEHYYDFDQPMNIAPPKEALDTVPIVPVSIQNNSGLT